MLCSEVLLFDKLPDKRRDSLVSDFFLKNFEGGGTSINLPSSDVISDLESFSCAFGSYFTSWFTAALVSVLTKRVIEVVNAAVFMSDLALSPAKCLELVNSLTLPSNFHWLLPSYLWLPWWCRWRHREVRVLAEQLDHQSYALTTRDVERTAHISTLSRSESSTVSVER